MKQTCCAFLITLSRTRLYFAREVFLTLGKPEYCQMENAVAGTSVAKQILWTKLQHNGPAFTKPYQPLPEGVGLIYDGQFLKLSALPEEMAVAYATDMHRKYAAQAHFKNNFFKDWKDSMSPRENVKVLNFAKCDFTKIRKHVLVTKGKKRIDRKLQFVHGFCTIDGQRTAVSNWNIEPPGLFKHKSPKATKDGKWKRRILPEDVIINCSLNNVPVAPKGHHWKEIVENRHVSWLAQWNDPIDGSSKYVTLDSSSTIKTVIDREKFDLAAKLGQRIRHIHERLREDYLAAEKKKRELVLVVYLIDSFAMKAGSSAVSSYDSQTLGWKSLRVERVHLHDELNGKTNVVEFIDGPISKTIDKWAFEGLQSLRNEKEPSDLMFGEVRENDVNCYLKSMMENLTSKVFRPFRASAKLEAELQKTRPNMCVADKMKIFQCAIQEVAKMCIHRRTETTVNLEDKLFKVNKNIEICQKELSDIENVEWIPMKEAKLEKLKGKKLTYEQQLQQTNQCTATETSMEHEIDPRIVVAWCLKHGVSVNKIFTTKKLRDKFRWAVELNCEKYVFYEEGSRTGDHTTSPD
ncbi:DNA topoisomerase 1-like [Armigeres subalbatus]|uniref:DNA topoisomerase 1-like n=1 Tax=Armigeres subalbatus TaxID=124917 RepID=UPI002ECFF956